MINDKKDNHEQYLKIKDDMKDFERKLLPRMCYKVTFSSDDSKEIYCDSIDIVAGGCLVFLIDAQQENSIETPIIIYNPSSWKKVELKTEYESDLPIKPAY
jgi:hypothetical protein